MTVIVGVDGPTGSRSAIRLADREAGYRGSALVAVMAHGSDRLLAAPAVRPPASVRTAADRRIAAEAHLRDAVADALGERAGDVELRVVAGLPGRVLVDVAAEVGAEMIVLAANGVMARLPGEMSQYVMRHAPCPVLLVPGGMVNGAHGIGN